MMVTGYVKYTMGFKHQLWKQKGEEYRIHGRWGWLWLSSVRNRRVATPQGTLIDGPQVYMVQVRYKAELKEIAVDPATYSYLQNNFDRDDGSDVNTKEEDMEMSGDEENDTGIVLFFNSNCFISVIRAGKYLSNEVPNGQSKKSI